MESIHNSGGPPPISDRDYIVATYNLLASLGYRVDNLEKSRQDSLREAEVFKLQEFDPVRRKVEKHEWQITVIGALSLPILVALVGYIINHIH